MQSLVFLIDTVTQAIDKILKHDHTNIAFRIYAAYSLNRENEIQGQAVKYKALNIRLLQSKIYKDSHSKSQGLLRISQPSHLECSWPKFA